MMPYLIGCLVGITLFVLGALYGSLQAERAERRRCSKAVETHECPHGERCSPRCREKISAVIRMSVERED